MNRYKVVFIKTNYNTAGRRVASPPLLYWVTAVDEYDARRKFLKDSDAVKTSVEVHVIGVELVEEEVYDPKARTEDFY